MSSSPNISQDCITIAIPFYRGLSYLKSAVDSVIAQNTPDWQLIVCDDKGADEGVEEFLQSYKDSRIHYHSNGKNLGMVSNWNKCLSMGGPHTSLLHADDQLEQNYISTIQAAIECHPHAAAWCCKSRIIDSKGKAVFSFPDFWKEVIEPPRTSEYYVLQGEAALSKLLAGNFIFCPTLCYNRRLLTGELFDRRWLQVQDLDLIYKILFAGHSIVLANAIGYAYRRHSENATAHNNAALLRFKEESKIYNETVLRCEELGWHKAVSVAKKKRIIKSNLLFFALSDCIEGRFSLSIQKMKYFLQLALGELRNDGEEQC